MRTRRSYKCANPDCAVMISRRICCSVACSWAIRSTKVEHKCEYAPCNNKTKNARFCSRSCSNLNNPRRASKKPSTNCQHCGSTLANKNNTYCSVTCQQQHKREQYIKKWLSGEISGTTPKGEISEYVRSYIYSIKGRVCWDCGWDKKHPLDGICPAQIEHIDGQASNNHISNLKVLCPSCHSLTLTYGGRNRNSTRTYRYK